LVQLSCEDVSICLGLTTIGEDVIFDNDVCGEVGVLFYNKEIKIKDTIERIKMLVSKENHVNSISHLYVLMFFAVFYFPRTSRIVTNMSFGI